MNEKAGPHLSSRFRLNFSYLAIKNPYQTNWTDTFQLIFVRRVKTINYTVLRLWKFIKLENELEDKDFTHIPQAPLLHLIYNFFVL